LGEITNLNKATTKNESLRTTVPRSIIKQFGLTQDDQLEWNLKAEGGELIIQVKPIKNPARAEKMVNRIPNPLNVNCQKGEAVFYNADVYPSSTIEKE